jgi:eukaryotic-like serine/threonine-protein kinase
MEPSKPAQRLPSIPEVGELVKGKYRLLRLLGDGGMGSVYEARHEGLGIKVALKFLHPRLSRWPGLVQRFLDEARLAAPIRSPSVVQVLDVDRSDEGLAFIVLELLSGQTLRELLNRRRLTEIEARAFTMQLCDGLEAVHDAGIVHRDLKPENVMVTRGPSGEPLLKLLDFGVAMPDGAGDRGSLPGTLLGTPGYMAPEQVSGAGGVDARADLYSLGVLLFEMLTGCLPDDKANLAEILPGVAPEIARAIARAMAPWPGDRFAAAAELRAAIALPPPTHALTPVTSVIDLSPPPSRASRTSVEVPWFVADPVLGPPPPPDALPAPPPAPPAPAPRRNRWIVAAIALALVAGIGLGGGATVLIPRGPSGATQPPDSVVAAMAGAPSTTVEADPAPPAEPAPDVAPGEMLSSPPPAPPPTAAAKPRPRALASAKPASSAALRPPPVPPPRRSAEPAARLPDEPPREAQQRPPSPEEPDPWPGARPPRKERRDRPRRELIILIPVR